MQRWFRRGDGRCGHTANHRAPSSWMLIFFLHTCHKDGYTSIWGTNRWATDGFSFFCRLNKTGVLVAISQLGMTDWVFGDGSLSTSIMVFEIVEIQIIVAISYFSFFICRRSLLIWREMTYHTAECNQTASCRQHTSPDQVSTRRDDTQNISIIVNHQLSSHWPKYFMRWKHCISPQLMTSI